MDSPSQTPVIRLVVDHRQINHCRFDYVMIVNKQSGNFHHFYLTQTIALSKKLTLYRNGCVLMSFFFFFQTSNLRTQFSHCDTTDDRINSLIKIERKRLLMIIIRNYPLVITFAKDKSVWYLASTYRRQVE